MIINTDLIYPIGSIYLSMNATNPSKFFGGTWIQISQGRCLVGVDTSDSEFVTAGLTGGSKYLQGHKHSTSWSVTGTGNKGQSYDGMPFVRAGNLTNDSQLMWTGYRSGTGSQSGIQDLSGNQINVGTSGNLQPYLTCYIWQRTA